MSTSAATTAATFKDYLKMIHSESIRGLIAGTDAILKDIYAEHCNLNNIKNTIENSIRTLSIRKQFDISIPLQQIVTPHLMKYITGRDEITIDMFINMCQRETKLSDKFKYIVFETLAAKVALSLLKAELTGLSITNPYIGWYEKNAPVINYSIWIPEDVFIIDNVN